MAYYHHPTSASNREAMGSLDMPVNGASTLAFLADQYDPDAAGPRSPMLQARKLELRVSRSPSPVPTQVKPSRGDAVLMQYMGDGKNPDIYNTAGNRALSVSSGDGGDNDTNCSDPEPEDDDRTEEQENGEDTRMGGNFVKGAFVAQESRTEPVTARELLGIDIKEKVKVKHDSCGLSSTVSPQALTDRDDMCLDGTLPYSRSNVFPGDLAGMIAVATAAVTAQKAKAQPDPREDDSKMAVDEPSAVAATTAQSESLLASGESSPSKPKYVALDALSLEDRKLFGADKRSPVGGNVNTPGDRSQASDSYAYAPTEHMQSTETAGQLPTPASMATPQESSSAIAAQRDGRQMTNSAAGTASFATPSSTSSPNEHPYEFPYSPNNFTSSRLSQPLPPMQYNSHYASADSCTKPLSPTNVNGIGDNAPMLPSIHALGLGSGPASDEQRRGAPTSDSYSRSYPQRYSQLPCGSLPSLSSIAHSHNTPPISPNDAYHRSNDVPLSNNNATGGSGSYYSSPRYDRRGSAVLGLGGVESPNRAHPVLAAARTVARAAAPAAPAATPEPALRQASVQGKGSDSSGGPENETMSAVDAALTATASHVAPGNYKCEQPGCTAQPFQTQYLLNSHLNVHSEDRPHYCSVRGCPRSRPGHGFKRKNEMIRHGLVHESPGYVCPFCPDREHKYPRPDNLQRHVRAHHRDKAKDDPRLRDVLAQRPDGANQRRRRRLA